MSVRSLTVVLNKDSQELMTMYRHGGGDPEQHGQELADFLTRGRLVNGFTTEERQTWVFNGMGCLAAWIVAEFKDGPGIVYLLPAGTRDIGEDYVYTVYAQNERIKMRVGTCITMYSDTFKTFKKYPVVLFDDDVGKYVGREVEETEDKMMDEIWRAEGVQNETL